MYTSCPECGTVFRISTTELRAAEGYARCGNCSATFNAVATLTDEPPPTVTVQQLVLPTEPEPEADERVAGPEPDAATQDEPQGPGTSPDEEAAAPVPSLPVSDDTLEFDIPEDSWSNFFEAGASPAAATSGPPEIETESSTNAVESTHAPDVGAGVGSDTVDQAGLYRALAAETGVKLEDDADWQALLREVGDEDQASQPVYVVSWDESAPEQTPAPLPPDFVPDVTPLDFNGLEPEPAPVARPEPSVADRPFTWEPPVPPPAETGRHWGYTAGSSVAALLLVIQLLHTQRDELATNPGLTEALQRTYTALGLPLWPAWDLGSYQLRTSEAVADRSSAGVLDILGRIAVVGDDRTGLPLVRVTLRDRFGKPLGSRVFQPAEYLGGNAQLREPVSPGTLIPVEIRLKDPGRDAQGFDVDVCIMSRRDGITCTADREPFAR